MTDAPRSRLVRNMPTVLRRLVRVGTLHADVEGSTVEIVGSKPGLEASIAIHDADAGAVARRVLRTGGVGFAVAYIDGLWDTTDLAGLLELAADTTIADAIPPYGKQRCGPFGPHGIACAVQQAPIRWAPWLSTTTFGNEFYAAWLDPSMSYSSGIFSNGDDLESAMRTKYERIAARAGIRPGDRVLEIGCGTRGSCRGSLDRLPGHRRRVRPGDLDRDDRVDRWRGPGSIRTT